MQGPVSLDVLCVLCLTDEYTDTCVPFTLVLGIFTAQVSLGPTVLVSFCDLFINSISSAYMYNTQCLPVNAVK